MNLDPDAATANTYVAAIAGAIVGMRALAGSTPLQRLSNLFSGFLMAVYTGPLVADYVHATSPKVVAGLVFAVGIGGLVVFGAVVDGVKQTQFGSIISGWLSRNRSV